MECAHLHITDHGDINLLVSKDTSLHISLQENEKKLYTYPLSWFTSKMALGKWTTREDLTKVMQEL